MNQTSSLDGKKIAVAINWQ
ncbi:hypothetical protein LSEI_1236 [Lacticaseibacillus paracasei ATCC 334]|uniref:Uncharacterized protein n=1 Tax=Lacticaseibacillus paracasei (strain ATCC 334 / BCRC 17002 / CCUG 31169 / CIP 107868 / KCTC 3260 / NRRL B-441) TaxID=321967 RepID=Q039V0_LACP3|nr:hypothetical protein LSEI_1236 [Lacticaseibacillus paracasei ATCC 334]